MPKYPTNTKPAQVAAPNRPGSPSGSQGRPQGAANDNKPGPMEIKLPELTNAQMDDFVAFVGGFTPPGAAMNVVLKVFAAFGIEPPETEWFPANKNNPNWNLVTQCLSGGQYWGSNSSATCGGYYAGFPGGYPNGVPDVAGRIWGYNFINPNFGNTFQNVSRYQRVPASGDPSTLGNPGAAPVVYPLSPSIEPAPFVFPIARPQPKPEPAKRPKPGEEPKLDPVPTAPPVYDLPAVPGMPPFIIVPDRNDVQVQVRDVIINIVGDKITVERPVGRPTNQVPPVRVQRKNNVAILGGVVWTGINTVTEVYDFIVAMHKSLPEPYQLSGKASKTQVLQYMVSNPEVWTHIDTAEAIQNYINMQVSDYVAAFGSGAIKRLSQQLGINTGLDHAIREVGDNWDDAGGGNLGDLVPELDIDAVSGTVKLVWKQPHVKGER